MFTLRLLFVAISASHIAQPILADTLHATNGDVISGQLISYRDGLCVFSTRYGATIRIPTVDIATLETDDPYGVILASGERISGRLTRINGKAFINSPTLGSVKFDISTVDSLVRDFSSSVKRDAQDSRAVGGRRYGEEAEKEAPLNFLTGSTVLLAKGQYEAEVGLSFKQSRQSFALPAAGYFQKSSYAAQQLRVDASVRAGLYEGVEGWINVPVSYSYVEEVSTNDYVRDAEALDIGDISFGLQYQIVEESVGWPAVSATIAVTAPTGKKHYYDAYNTWRDPLNNGSGHWGISPGLAFVRTTDPAIIFGGTSLYYFLEREIDGYSVQPGWGAGFYFGVGYALNENLSVGTRFSYTHFSNMKAGNVEMFGSDTDPMDISLSASYRIAMNWVATPQVTFNLNNDAGIPSFSLRLKRQFD